MAIEDARWYVIHTYSGYEAMVQDSLEKLIENNNLQENIFEIQVPTEETLEEKANGKKKLVKRKKFPCYDLALTAAEMGDNYPCALNGAGEVAVRAFLDGRIAFTEIANTIADALEKTERLKADSYAILKKTDAQAREYASAFVHKYEK